MTPIQNKKPMRWKRCFGASMKHNQMQATGHVWWKYFN